jgi:ParB family chromosome partitioning protein
MPDVELKRIQPNRLNPRLEFRKQALDELADSIKQVGLIEPIVVRPDGKNNFEVVVGERRYRAAQQARLDKVPVIIRAYSDEEVLELNLVENVQKEDLSAVEKAKVCQQLRERFPDRYPTWESVAQRIGVNVETLRHWTDTLDLPKPVQRLIAPRETERVPKGKIDYQTAVRIARTVKSPKKQVEVAKEFAQRHVSWRAAREVLKEVVKKPQRTVQTVMREVVMEAPIYLPFSKVHADAILRGKKTQTSRKSKDPRLQQGATVRAAVTHFADLQIVSVARKRLGDFDEKDAKAEGGYTLSEFKKVWKNLHGTWNSDETVYTIKFRVQKVIGAEP